MLLVYGRRKGEVAARGLRVRTPPIAPAPLTGPRRSSRWQAAVQRNCRGKLELRADARLASTALAQIAEPRYCTSFDDFKDWDGNRFTHTDRGPALCTSPSTRMACPEEADT